MSRRSKLPSKVTRGSRWLVRPYAPLFAIHHEFQLRLPYLPDPLSRGATLCGVAGVPAGKAGVLDSEGQLVFVNSILPPANIAALGSTTQIDFGKAWPERAPFRLRLAEPTDPDGPSEQPTWTTDPLNDPPNRVLTVHLGKAEQSTVRLSSFLGKDDLGNDDLDLLGVWRWVLEQRKAEGLPPPDARDLEPAIVGAMWMLTPFSKINLVHAVQQPLLAPQLTALSTVRDLGASFAYFGATVPIHGRSTARLDVQAGCGRNVSTIHLTQLIYLRASAA